MPHRIGLACILPYLCQHVVNHSLWKLMSCVGIHIKYVTKHSAKVQHTSGFLKLA